MDIYERFKKTLNAEQKELLKELCDKHARNEIETYNKGLAEGKMHGIVAAVKAVMNAL